MKQPSLPFRFLLPLTILIATSVASPLRAAEFLITDFGAVGNNAFDNAPVIIPACTKFCDFGRTEN